jgi:hypothetical protein
VSPDDYYREGEGSLMQCVLTPADPYLPLPNEEIARRVDAQVRKCVVHMALGHLSFSLAPQTELSCGWELHEVWCATSAHFF